MYVLYLDTQRCRWLVTFQSPQHLFSCTTITVWLWNSSQLTSLVEIIFLPTSSHHSPVESTVAGNWDIKEAHSLGGRQCMPRGPGPGCAPSSVCESVSWCRLRQRWEGLCNSPSEYTVQGLWENLGEAGDHRERWIRADQGVYLGKQTLHLSLSTPSGSVASASL